MKNLGERIYELRTKHSLSQGDLADKMNVSRQTVSKWENNMSVPELDKLISLSEIFGVSIDEIVKGSEEVFSPFEKEVQATVPLSETKRRIRKPLSYTNILSVFCGFFLLINLITGIKSTSHIASVLGTVEVYAILLHIVNFITIIALFLRKGRIIFLCRCFHPLIDIGFLLGSFIGATNFDGIIYLPRTIVGIIIEVLIVFGLANKKENMSKKYGISILVFTLIHMLITCFISFCNYMDTFNYSVHNGLLSVLSSIPSMLPNLITCICFGLMVYYKNKPTPEGTEYEISELYVDMAKLIILSVFTFGIYHLIWIYRTTYVLNITEKHKEQNPTSKLLLFIFVPFYAIYWYYSQAKRVETITKEAGKTSSDLALIVTLLAVFVPVAAPILLQYRMNNCTK